MVWGATVINTISCGVQTCQALSALYKVASLGANADYGLGELSPQAGEGSQGRERSERRAAGILDGLSRRNKLKQSRRFRMKQRHKRLFAVLEREF